MGQEPEKAIKLQDDYTVDIVILVGVDSTKEEIVEVIDCWSDDAAARPSNVSAKPIPVRRRPGRGSPRVPNQEGMIHRPAISE